MQRYRRAVELALGFGAASNLEPLSRDWADGLAWLESEVDETHYKINAKRSDARAMARMKSGRLFG